MKHVYYCKKCNDYTMVILENMETQYQVHCSVCNTHANKLKEGVADEREGFSEKSKRFH